MTPAQQQARSLAAVLGPRATVRDLPEGRAALEVAVRHGGRQESHVYLFAVSAPTWGAWEMM